MKLWLKLKAEVYELWLRLTMEITTRWRRLLYFVATYSFIGFLPDLLNGLVEFSDGTIILIDNTSFINEYIPARVQEFIKATRMGTAFLTGFIPLLVKNYHKLKILVNAYKVQIGLMEAEITAYRDKDSDVWVDARDKPIDLSFYELTKAQRFDNNNKCTKAIFMLKTKTDE